MTPTSENTPRASGRHQAAAVARRIVLEVLDEHGEADLAAARGAAWRAAEDGWLTYRDSDEAGYIARWIALEVAAEHRAREPSVPSVHIELPRYQVWPGAAGPVALFFGQEIAPSGRRWPELSPDGPGLRIPMAGDEQRRARLLGRRVDEALAPLVGGGFPPDRGEAASEASPPAAHGGRSPSGLLAGWRRWVLAAALGAIGFVTTLLLGRAALRDVVEVDLDLELDSPTQGRTQAPAEG